MTDPDSADILKPVDQLADSAAMDRFLKSHSEQTDSHLTDILAKLTTAVEGFKTQREATTDTKTTFWTVYKTLAGEFDKEFFDRYGDDLNTGLIFAGLFSAVNSAFIIQIQPQIQPGVLAVVVAAHAVLYFSLQWLFHYNSMDERGTIEERGLQRQRKLDALHHWKFGMVMHSVPLLLQISLLLFAGALSIYLWTIQRAVAGIVLGMTGLGFALYVVMIISAIVSPESPYQTTVGLLLKAALTTITIPQWFGGAVRKSRSAVVSTFTRLHAVVSGTVGRRPLLPHWKAGDSDSKAPAAPPGYPTIVQSAAAMVPDLQWWPTTLDLSPPLDHLADTFVSCFDRHTIHPEATSLAMSCIRAFRLLEMVLNEPQGPPELWQYRQLLEDLLSPDTGDELHTKVSYFCLRGLGALTDMLAGEVAASSVYTMQLIQTHPFLSTQVGAVLDCVRPDDHPKTKPLIGNFTLCLDSFARYRAGQAYPFSSELITLLFENLSTHLTTTPPDQQVVIAILAGVANAASWASYHRLGLDTRCMNTIYHFCATPGVSQRALAPALQLLRLPVDVWNGDGWTPLVIDFESRNIEWAYNALEGLDDSENDLVGLVGDLLQVLLRCRPIEWKGTTCALGTILSALSALSDRDHYRIKYLVAGLLCSASHWFQDPELGPMMGGESLWPHLAGVANPDYIALAEKLCTIEGWESIISADLPGWLSQLPRIIGPDRTILGYTENHELIFRSMLSRAWAAHEVEVDNTGDDLTLAMAISALTTTWATTSVVDLEMARQVGSSQAPGTIQLLFGLV
ncbi:hypothetical protein B0H16DRAFT_1716158 [Mycena metata]|uniref:DUF6535 domain-containing protein n=1 Tax=Mycena metata TaxID=1033252 RepID=A0AAD7JRL0_9AGAR|nr:hypothetical protein B0H16DRAFT_1716158 [Mycena metata]